MIEYEYEVNIWADITGELLTLNVENLTFDLYRLRINGIIYDRNNEEFRQAYAKQMMWEKLSD